MMGDDVQKNIFGEEKTSHYSDRQKARNMIKAGYKKIAEEYDDPAYKRPEPERVSDFVKRQLQEGNKVSPLQLISAGYDELRDREEITHLKRLARQGSTQAAERLKMLQEQEEKKDSKDSGEYVSKAEYDAALKKYEAAKQAYEAMKGNQGGGQ